MPSAVWSRASANSSGSKQLERPCRNGDPNLHRIWGRRCRPQRFGANAVLRLFARAVLDGFGCPAIHDDVGALPAICFLIRRLSNRSHRRNRRHKSCHGPSRRRPSRRHVPAAAAPAATVDTAGRRSIDPAAGRRRRRRDIDLAAAATAPVIAAASDIRTRRYHSHRGSSHLLRPWKEWRWQRVRELPWTRRLSCRISAS